MRILLSIALLLGLTSCQPPILRIIAVVESGKIMFHVRKPGFFIDRIFGWDDDLYLPLDIFTILADDKIYWKLSGTDISDEHKIFPLTYGSIPTHSKQIIEAIPLSKGKEYEIELNGGERAYEPQSGYGTFKITLSGKVINF